MAFKHPWSVSPGAGAFTGAGTVAKHPVEITKDGRWPCQCLRWTRRSCWDGTRRHQLDAATPGPGIAGSLARGRPRMLLPCCWSPWTAATASGSSAGSTAATELTCLWACTDSQPITSSSQESSLRRSLSLAGRRCRKRNRRNLLVLWSWRQSFSILAHRTKSSCCPRSPRWCSFSFW
jgi:hypothetical protein